MNKRAEQFAELTRQIEKTGEAMRIHRNGFVAGYRKGWKHCGILSAILVGVIVTVLSLLSCTPAHVAKRPGKMLVTGETVRVDILDEPVNMANVVARRWIICHNWERHRAVFIAYKDSAAVLFAFPGKYTLDIPGDFHPITNAIAPVTGDTLIVRMGVI